MNVLGNIKKLLEFQGCSEIINNCTVESGYPSMPISTAQREISEPIENTEIIKEFQNNIFTRTIEIKQTNKHSCLIISQFDVNSLRNKFRYISSFIIKYLDILLISETRLRLYFYISSI